MVVDEMAIFTQRERWRGFCDALANAGHTIDDTLVRFGVHDATSAELVAQELLTFPKPPTAIFAANNRITTGILRALRDHGDDIEVVGFDDLELTELLARPPSTISYDAAGLGREAARLLAARLDGHAGPPQRIVLPTELVARGIEEVPA